jgi:hypothetical protein
MKGSNLQAVPEGLPPSTCAMDERVQSAGGSRGPEHAEAINVSAALLCFPAWLPASNRTCLRFCAVSSNMTAVNSNAGSAGRATRHNPFLAKIGSCEQLRLHQGAAHHREAAVLPEDLVVSSSSCSWSTVSAAIPTGSCELPHASAQLLVLRAAAYQTGARQPVLEERRSAIAIYDFRSSTRGSKQNLRTLFSAWSVNVSLPANELCRRWRWMSATAPISSQICPL